MELIEEASRRPDAKTVIKVAEKTVTVCDECTTTPRVYVRRRHPV